MKRLFLTLVVLLVPIAQAKPHPIHWVKHHKLLILTSAAFVAADMADTKTSIDVQRRCPACAEVNDDIYGKHPSAARLWGESAAIDAGYIWLNWFGTKDTGLTGTKDFTAAERKSHPKLYRMVWMEKPATIGVMGWAAEAHARAAWLNAQIPATKR